MNNHVRQYKVRYGAVCVHESKAKRRVLSGSLCFLLRQSLFPTSCNSCWPFFFPLNEMDSILLTILGKALLDSIPISSVIYLMTPTFFFPSSPAWAFMMHTKEVDQGEAMKTQDPELPGWPRRQINPYISAADKSSSYHRVLPRMNLTIFLKKNSWVRAWQCELLLPRHHHHDHLHPRENTTLLFLSVPTHHFTVH